MSNKFTGLPVGMNVCSKGTLPTKVHIAKQRGRWYVNRPKGRQSSALRFKLPPFPCCSLQSTEVVEGN